MLIYEIFLFFFVIHPVIYFIIIYILFRFNIFEPPLPFLGSSKIKEYLKEHFHNIEWIEEAVIEKIDSYRIKIYTDKNSLSLELNNNKKKFKMKMKNGEVKEYPSFCESKIFREGLWSVRDFLGLRISEWLFRCKSKEMRESDNIIRNLFKSIPILIFSSLYVGGFMVLLFDLEMNDAAWFHFFGMIATAFAALVALISMFLIFYIEFLEKKGSYLNLNEAQAKKAQAKNLMEISLKYSAYIIGFSIILLPFGSVTVPNDMFIIWNILKIKWFVIFAIVGFSIGTLYKIYSAIIDLIKDIDKR